MLSYHPSTDQPFSSPRSSSQLISAVLHARKLLLSERSLLHKNKTEGAESFCTQKLETQIIYTGKPLQHTLYDNACTSTSQYYFVLQSLHRIFPSTTLYYKACTEYFPALLCTTKLAQSTSQYYFVLQSLHKARPSTSLYYKACTEYFPVLLCTTKLARNISQYYFVLQSLHKHFPVLLCTTKLAQSTSQYYFVLQSLHKARPSTSFYYKACTKHVPLLLCTTKLAQSTSQYYYICTTQLAQSTSLYYFVLRSLHKTRPTTFYYKACTKHFPLLLCTTQLAQSTLLYHFCTTKLAQSTSQYFVLHSLHRALPCTTLYYKACTKHKAQSLHKARPSTTLYHKACTEHFPVALCTTKLAQSTSQYFVLQILRKAAAPSNLCAKAKKNTILKHFLKGI